AACFWMTNVRRLPGAATSPSGSVVTRKSRFFQYVESDPAMKDGQSRDRRGFREKPGPSRFSLLLQAALVERDAFADAKARVGGVTEDLARAVVEAHAHFPARVARFALMVGGRGNRSAAKANLLRGGRRLGRDVGGRWGLFGSRNHRFA